MERCLTGRVDVRRRCGALPRSYDVDVLRDVADALRSVYGDLDVEITDPFEMVLLENAAYLVDDARRIGDESRGAAKSR